MADQFLINQIAKIENQIDALQDAIFRLSENEVVTYSLDNGQTKETVTRRGITGLDATVTKLLNKRKQLRINCGLETAGTILRSSR